MKGRLSLSLSLTLSWSRWCMDREYLPFRETTNGSLLPAGRKLVPKGNARRWVPELKALAEMEWSLMSAGSEHFMISCDISLDSCLFSRIADRRFSDSLTLFVFFFLFFAQSVLVAKSPRRPNFWTAATVAVCNLVTTKRTNMYPTLFRRGSVRYFNSIVQYFK